MPTVPYSGVPTVAPQDNPTPRYTADTPPAAFGVNVANAIEGLGKTAEGVGNEIFARGVAMQDLYNHSEAQQADADYMQKAGELHAHYSSLSGKTAVDAYPQYIKDLQDARKGIRDGLSNSMSQKMFDSQSLSTMGRTIFNGAGHAATENKKYALGASSARVDAISDQTLSTPTDDAAFKDGLAKSEQEVRAQADLQGMAPEAADEAVAQTRSRLWSQRITGLVKQQPIAASKMLDAAVKAGDVRGEDIAKLTNLVQQTNHTVGARMTSQLVSSGANGRWGTGEIDIKQAGEAIGQIESGGNYSTIGVQTKHGRALGKYQIMEEFLPDFLSKAGLPAMSAEEFLKNHSAQDQTFAANFGAYMKQTGSANDAASMWLTGKPLAQAGDVKDAFGTNATTYVARFNAALAKNAPLSAKEDMGIKIASAQSPDDPLMPDYVRDRIQVDHNHDIAVKRDDKWQAEQPIESTLVGAMSKDGKIPTTVEELTADPKTAAAWDWLGQNYPAKQRYYLEVMARHSKGDHALTPETLKQYVGFTGEAINRPGDFVNEDILGTNLPIAKKAELVKLQQSIQGKTDQGNPAVQQAMRESADIINAAGITTKDKEDYDRFTGAVADQLRQHSLEDKKPPNFEERRTIVSRLLQTHSTPGWLWGTNQVPTYKIPVPPNIIEESKKLDPTLTDEEIQRRYTNLNYQRLYGGTPKVLVPVSK